MGERDGERFKESSADVEIGTLLNASGVRWWAF